MRRVPVLAAAVLLCWAAIGCVDQAATGNLAGVPADDDSAAVAGSTVGAEATAVKAADVLAAALAEAGRSDRRVFVHASAEW